MRRMMQRSAFLGDDEGATLVFAAVVLIAILALAAFAIDFGRMWEERRQLQNGADAAALAIAEDCARGLCGLGYDEYAVAEVYVDTNARDGLAWAHRVDLDLTNQTVTVYNATEDPGGDHKFDMLLAGIVGFDGFTVGAKATAAWGYSEQVATLPLIISACEWSKDFPEGPGGNEPANEDDPYPAPDHLFDVPSFSQPRVPWLADPNNNWPDPLPSTWPGGGYSPPSSYPPPATLTFHDANVTDDCAAQAGQDRDGDNRLPGGFGWLKVNDTEDCEAAVYEDDFSDFWAASDTGNGGPPPACDTVIENLLMESAAYGGQVVIPVYNDFWEGPADGSGPCGNSGKCYRIATRVGFHVVGYKLASGSNTSAFIFDNPATPGTLEGPVEPPKRPNGNYWQQSKWVEKFDCVPATSGTQEVCLIGYFSEYVDNGGSGTITGSGVGVVKLIG